MFIEIRGVVYNMFKYSKVVKESTLTGSFNRLTFWNGQSPNDYIDFAEDIEALDTAYDFIKTSTSTVTLVE